MGATQWGISSGSRDATKRRYEELATLCGTGRDPSGHRSTQKQLLIAPVPPSVEGPTDAYDVAFGPDWEGKYVQIRGDVSGWQLGHSYFECIAEMFCGAEVLHALKGTRHACADTLHTGAARTTLDIGLDWLHVMISDASSTRYPDNISVQIYIADPEYSAQSGPDAPAHSQQNRFIVWGLNTTIAQASRFGDDLLIELTGARQKRIELGIVTEEDQFALSDESEP